MFQGYSVIDNRTRMVSILIVTVDFTRYWHYIDVILIAQSKKSRQTNFFPFQTITGKISDGSSCFPCNFKSFESGVWP